MPNAYPVYHKAKKAAIQKERDIKHICLGKGDWNLKYEHYWWFQYKRNSWDVCPGPLQRYTCKLEQLANQLTRTDEPVTYLDWYRSSDKCVMSDAITTAVALQIIYCGHCNLIELPVLPQTLKMLYCTDNFLSELPALPEGLHTLNCNGNNLTRLPALPEGLQTLNCNDNYLSELPALPKGLRILNCNGNNLTRLPDLPEGLTECWLPGKRDYNSIYGWVVYKYDEKLLENYPELNNIRAQGLGASAIIAYVNRRNRELA